MSTELGCGVQGLIQLLLNLQNCLWEYQVRFRMFLNFNECDILLCAINFLMLCITNLFPSSVLSAILLLSLPFSFFSKSWARQYIFHSQQYLLTSLSTRLVLWQDSWDKHYFKCKAWAVEFQVKVRFRTTLRRQEILSSSTYYLHCYLSFKSIGEVTTSSVNKLFIPKTTNTLSWHFKSNNIY